MVKDFYKVNEKKHQEPRSKNQKKFKMENEKWISSCGEYFKF
jgi:hypothetical protein